MVYDGSASKLNALGPGNGPNSLVELPESVQNSGPQGADGREIEHETQEGQVFSVVFHAEDSGFSVIVLETEDGAVTAAGELGEVHPGDYLRLHGRWREHPRFGRQFQAQWSEAATPTTLDGLQQYLASGAFSGIGADMAKRLVDHFGEHTLEALEGGARTLQAVDGIGPKRAAVLAEAFADGRDRHRVLAELRGLGLRPAQTQKLYERWGPAAIERVRQDPYALIGSLRGIGFETAERIAGQLGIPTDSVVRARGVIRHRLREALGEGHTWLPEAELEQRLGGRGLSAETITEGLADLIREDKLACEIEPVGDAEQRWYALPKVRDDESDLARHLARLMGAPHEPAAAPDQVMSAMERAAFQPDESQRQALELALRRRRPVRPRDILQHGGAVGNELAGRLTAHGVRVLLGRPLCHRDGRGGLEQHGGDCGHHVPRRAPRSRGRRRRRRCGRTQVVLPEPRGPPPVLAPGVCE